MCQANLYAQDELVSTAHPSRTYFFCGTHFAAVVGVAKAAARPAGGPAVCMEGEGVAAVAVAAQASCVADASAVVDEAARDRHAGGWWALAVRNRADGAVVPVAAAVVAGTDGSGNNRARVLASGPVLVLADRRDESAAVLVVVVVAQADHQQENLAVAR